MNTLISSESNYVPQRDHDFDDNVIAVPSYGSTTSSSTSTTSSLTSSSLVVTDSCDPHGEVDSPDPLSDIIDQCHFGLFHHRLMFVCGLIYAADAVEVILLSFLVPELQDNVWHFSDQVAGLLGGMVFLGMLLGALFWGLVADFYGRRLALIYAVLITCIFGLASPLCQDVDQLIALRFFVGFGVAGTHNAFSLFIEFLPSSSRGRSLILLALYWTGGVCSMSLISYLSLTFSNWRIMLLTSATPLMVCLPLLLCTKWMPESPHYLMGKGRVQEVEAIITSVFNINKIPLNNPITLSSYLPSSSSSVVRPSSSSFSSSSTLLHLSRLFHPSLWLSTCCLWLIWSANSLTYYGAAFLAPRLFQGQSPELASFVTALGEVPGCVIFGLWCVDRIGRKSTIALNFALVGVSCIVLALSTSLPVQMTFLFIARMSASAAFNTNYVYTPELYPTSLRATGLGSCSAVSRVAGFVTSLLVSSDAANTVLFVFAGAGFVACAITCAMKETTGAKLRADVHAKSEASS